MPSVKFLPSRHYTCCKSLQTRGGKRDGGERARGGNRGVFLQGGERARRSVLSDGDAPLTHYYSDARTMYEVFQRGIRVSRE